MLGYTAGPLAATARPREGAAAEEGVDVEEVEGLEHAIELQAVAGAGPDMARAQAPARTQLG